MGKYYFHRWFTVLMLLYCIARLVRWSFPEAFPLFSGYFTDILFVPAMCSFSLIFTRMIKRDATLKVKWYLILLITVAISYYFEYYLPFQPGNTYISDCLDLVCYSIGAVLYGVIQYFEPKFTSSNL